MSFVGKLWRIKNPNTIPMGCDQFLYERLKKGDLFLCICNDGDACQIYMYVKEYHNAYEGCPNYTFCSYGVGNATEVPITPEEFETLKNGGDVNKADVDFKRYSYNYKEKYS